MAFSIQQYRASRFGSASQNLKKQVKAQKPIESKTNITVLEHMKEKTVEGAAKDLLDLKQRQFKKEQ